MQTTTHPFFSAAPGTSHHLTAHHFGPSDSTAKKVYMQASLHADEIPAMLVAVVLQERLKQYEAEGRVRGAITLVPAANPLGMGQAILGSSVGRFDLGNGQNFNRAFPMLGDAIAERIEGKLGSDAQENAQLIRQTMAQLLREHQPATAAQAMQKELMLLAHDADVVLDMHCASAAPMHFYASDAIWDEVEPLARYLGSTANLLALDSGAQSFDEAFSYTWYVLQQRFGEQYPIPNGSWAVTIEHRGQRDVTWELAEQDAEAILNYLAHIGVLDIPAPELPELLHPATPLAGSDYIHATTSGIVVYHVKPGDYIEVDQTILEIVDPISGTRTPIKARVAGVFFSGRDIRFARMGDSLARIAGTTPHRSGNLLGA